MFSWLKMAVHNHLLGLNSSWRHIHHLLIKQNQSYESIINLDLATLHFGIFDELRLIQDTSWRLHYNITWTVCLSVPWIYYEHVFQDMIWLCLFQRPCLRKTVLHRKEPKRLTQNLKDLMEKTQNQKKIGNRSRIGASSSLESSMKRILRRFESNQNKSKQMKINDVFDRFSS